MTVELEEFEPGKWRVRKMRCTAPKSHLSLPYVISDIMPPTEQVDGQFYTSKSAFRRVGRANGLIEIGTEKLTPKQKTVDTPVIKQQRRNAIKKAFAKVVGG